MVSLSANRLNILLNAIEDFVWIATLCSSAKVEVSVGITLNIQCVLDGLFSTESDWEHQFTDCTYFLSFKQTAQ